MQAISAMNRASERISPFVPMLTSTPARVHAPVNPRRGHPHGPRTWSLRSPVAIRTMLYPGRRSTPSIAYTTAHSACCARWRVRDKSCTIPRRSTHVGVPVTVQSGRCGQSTPSENKTQEQSTPIYEKMWSWRALTDCPVAENILSTINLDCVDSVNSMESYTAIPHIVGCPRIIRRTTIGGSA